MPDTTCHMSISLDGFVAGPDQSREHPLGKRGLELHSWHIGDERATEADDAAGLDELSARERHKVRIKAKKLRYAIDFFESLFSRKGERRQLARLSRHLKRVQDALGSLNDFVAHRKLAVDAALKAPHRKERASAFASGVVLGREEQAVKPLIKVAAREVRGLEKF